jgi:hypothetical protein
MVRRSLRAANAMTAGNTVKLIASVNITIASSMLFLRR